MLYRSLIVTLVVSLCTFFPAKRGAAEMIGQIVKDFSPVSGVVVMPMENREYLIDLDAAKGVSPGVPVAVVKPGKKIVHPETGAVLGSLEEVLGVLEVTRVKSGYSYARQLGDAENIERGDAVKLYEHVPARFLDATGRARGEYDQLQVLLGGLDWLPYQTVAADEASIEGFSGLTFVRTAERLEVRGVSSAVLRTYSVDPVVVGSTLPQSPVLPTPKAILDGPVASSAVILAPSESSAPEGGAALIRSKNNMPEGLWYGPEVSKEIRSIAVGDFDGDENLEIVLLFAHSLEVGQVQGGSYRMLERVETGNLAGALTVDAYDRNGDGREEIYVTAYQGEQPASIVLNWDDGHYVISEKNIPFFLRVIQVPGEGRVLAGQRMGWGNADYSGPLSRIAKGAGPVELSEVLDAPPGVGIHGYSPVMADGAGLHAYLSKLDKLKLLSGEGELLWESEQMFGGSEVGIERIDPNVRNDTGLNTRIVFLGARMGLHGDDQLLVPVNEGEGYLSRNRTYKSSYLVALQWDGRGMREAWRTLKQNGYLSDFQLADYDNDGEVELLTSVVLSRDGMFKKAKSSLVGYELN